ncbi:MAG TPA: type III polyketide synthase [Xanthobacteraceae bacterium]|nr:type III polyketide synthase [Xanthobacteraceae bacterium]
MPWRARVAPVALVSLATAVPPHAVDQDYVARRAREIYAPTLARHPGLIDVFAHTGIKRRFAACPLDWYEREHGWPERNAAYLAAAGALYREVTGAALRQAGLSARDIDTVVTVSSTGIATPSLEARLSKDIGFRADIGRVPVFGLGCAGGVTGLSLAAKLARTQPRSNVLFVALELCTLAFRRDRIDKAGLVATALFGDGAAAAVLRAGDAPGSLARIGPGYEHQWPDTLDIMGWSIDPFGFGVILSADLPRFVEQQLAAPAASFLAAAGLAAGATRFVCHPGGTKIVAALERALGFPPGTLEEERAVLRDCGNMSAPTVLFVLERTLRRRIEGPVALAALGPGFTASFLALEARGK